MGLRAGNARTFAAHGYVDNAYRPSRLPFVSLVGPLAFNVEPEREAGKRASAPVRVAGHVIGRPRALTDSVPAAGTLRLRFDGRATTTLTGLPGGSFGNPATGSTIAAAIQNGIHAALSSGQILSPSGAPIADPESIAALTQTTCRFDPDSRRLAISSGPGVVAAGNLSRVEVLVTPGSVAAALGLAPPESSRDGYTYLHRLPPPRAVTVDVQLNLWAANQQDLAAMIENLAVIAPTRGNLLIRPALLADDVAPAATSLRLLAEGEPTLADSLFHLEAGGGFRDRARGVLVTTSAGAAITPAPERLGFTGTGTASGRLYATPLVPSPLQARNPAPLGFAVSLGLRLDPGASAGQRLRLLDLGAGATRVLRLELALVTVTTSGGVSSLRADLEASATLSRNGAPVDVQTTFRLPIANVEQELGQLHVLVDSLAGTILLWHNGEPHRVDDPAQTPVAPVTAPGSSTSAAADMILTLGRADAANPIGFSLGHVHVIAALVGALDPNLRRSVCGPARLQPGDPLILARSDDGFRPSSVRHEAMVAAVNGDVVELTRPLPSAWPRGQTLAFRDECFYFQTSIKRRDDLLNHLYRACVDYRVSALLEDPRAIASAVLTENASVDLIALGGSRAPGGTPGVSGVITDTGTATIRKLTNPGA
jgi:hypothetical protein